MAYEVVMPYHLHMPSYFLETFTEYPYFVIRNEVKDLLVSCRSFVKLGMTDKNSIVNLLTLLSYDKFYAFSTTRSPARLAISFNSSLNSL